MSLIQKPETFWQEPFINEVFLDVSVRTDIQQHSRAFVRRFNAGVHVLASIHQAERRGSMARHLTRHFHGSNRGRLEVTRKVPFIVQLWSRVLLHGFRSMVANPDLVQPSVDMPPASYELEGSLSSVHGF